MGIQDLASRAAIGYATGVSCEPMTCCLCGHHAAPSETAEVRPNVRAFASETFTVWRCEQCGSIHALEAVDLAHYYAQYPFFRQTMDFAVKLAHRNLLRRLKRCGIRPPMRVLDFGCGSGLLTQSLRALGFDATGYDPYSETHNDPAVLDEPFDVLIAQDVIEHSEDPVAMLREFDSLVKPGGHIVIGTPNASGISLNPIGHYIHPLHQPYHRHILSRDMLAAQTESLSWRQTAYYKTPYTNMVLLSLPFLHRLMDHFDGTIDVLFDRPSSWRFWLHPKTWGLFLAGRWLCDDADILAIYQKT